MCQEELAWAAGLFDGEGGTYFQQPNPRWRGRPIVKMSQTDRFVLDRLCKVLGAGKVQGPKMPTRPNCKPVWTWECSRTENTVLALKAMWPWLSPPKRTQALTVLERWVNQPLPKAGKGILKAQCINGHPWDDACLDQGKRRCYECTRQNANRRYAKKRGEAYRSHPEYMGPRRHIRTAPQI